MPTPFAWGGNQIRRNQLTLPYRFDNTTINTLTIVGVAGARLDTRAEIFVTPETALQQLQQ